MAQTSFPFEGIDTTETQFSKWARNFNSGVNDEPTGSALEVSVGTGLAVSVAAGEAQVRGHYYISDAAESLALVTADATNDRLDLVVLKLDPTANSITLAVKTGTPAGSPSAPSPVQTDAGIYEMPLASVLVPANSGVPTTITDQREFMGTRLGSWSTAGRPTPAGRVLFGFNTDTDRIEFYNVNKSAWEDATPPSGENLLYNGAMQVAQRGTSETGITGSGYYTADRWQNRQFGESAVITQTVEADGPTGSGFTKSLKNEVTTADGSPAANSGVRIEQILEGQDLQGLKKGTSDAESLTLSFWVKSNVTGTYVVQLDDRDNTRAISATYSVSSSGTWERKTLTFAGDTTGAFDNDNAESLRLYFWLAAGTDYTSGTLNTSWSAQVNADSAVGQTDLIASSGNYWQITGVQLETGTTASDFEHKPYGVELAECQRYYYRIEPGASGKLLMESGAGVSGTIASFFTKFPVTMRQDPTALEQSGTAADYKITQTGISASVVPAFNSRTSVEMAQVNVTVASGLTTNASYSLESNAAGAYLAWSAEL